MKLSSNNPGANISIDYAIVCVNVPGCHHIWNLACHRQPLVAFPHPHVDRFDPWARAPRGGDVAVDCAVCGDNCTRVGYATADCGDDGPALNEWVRETERGGRTEREGEVVVSATSSLFSIPILCSNETYGAALLVAAGAPTFIPALPRLAPARCCALLSILPMIDA